MKIFGNKIKKPTRIYKVIEISLIICWLTIVQTSDSLYIPYLLVGVGSIICCFNRNQFGRPNYWLLSFIFSCILTFFTCSANYALFPSLNIDSILPTTITYLSLIIGSFLAFYNIFIYQIIQIFYSWNIYDQSFAIEGKPFINCS